MKLKGVLRAFCILAGMLILMAGAMAQDHVYRIVVLDNQNLDQARRLENLLQGLDYQPIFIDKQAEGQYRVLYGSFPSQAVADAALTKIQSEGIMAKSVIELARIQPAPGTVPEGGYSVLVAKFNTEDDAITLRDRLVRDSAGFSPVKVRQLGRFFEVYVGNHRFDEASLILGQLRQKGYTVDGVSRVVVAPARIGQPAEQPAEAPGQTAAAGRVTPTNALSPAITQTDLWKDLSPDQQRQVLKEVLLSTEMRSGDTVAQRVIDIDKRLAGLDERVRSLMERIESQTRQEQELSKQINDLFDQAENLARSGDYQQAIVLLKRAQDADKENLLGMLQYAQRRIDVLQAKLGGELYPGEAERNAATIQRLEAEAKQKAQGGTAADLTEAIMIWNSIKNLDAKKYGEIANTRIANLRQQLAARENDLSQTFSNQLAPMQKLIYYMGGAIAVLIVLFLLAWMRSRKQQKDLILRLQEITSASMRPMRELGGGGTGRLSDGTGDELFTPRKPAAAVDEVMADPLGGVSSKPIDEPKPARGRLAKKDKAPETSAFPPPAADSTDMDALFAHHDDAPPKQEEKTSTYGRVQELEESFDSLFAGEDEKPPTPPKAPKAPKAETTAALEPEPTATSAVDDVFGSFFAGAGDEEPHAKPAGEPKAKADETGPISFTGLDFHAEDESKSKETGSASSVASDDLLAIFDDAIGQEDAPPDATVTSEGLSRLKDSPFESLVGGGASGMDLDDDTEIPSIRLDETEADTGKAHPSAETAINEIFNFDAPDSDQTIPTSPVNIEEGVSLDFEDDTAGETPRGWEGEYPFASLTVRGDTPARGAHQYLCFEKKEGDGKAFFSYRFAPVSGKVGIEFDMRCNDKNKFLLGIYFEKDGDFQRAIHTKILRSEAQTTPTIHMQGEAAPYLLGSWAHIKYVVDLNRGRLDSYIDNTHVGHDVTIDPNPGSIDTLSIRDNINTTGVLLLDNIKVYPLA